MYLTKSFCHDVLQTNTSQCEHSISYKTVKMLATFPTYKCLQSRLHLMPARDENSGVGYSNYGT